jgi:acetyl esterase/lipase
MAQRYTGGPKKPGNAVLRCAALLPPLLALPVAVAALMTLPMTQRFFLPPPETISELIAYSERQPEPEGPTRFDVEYHRDLLRRYHLDIYGPLSGTDGAGAAFTAASPVIVFFHGGSWLRGDKITIRVIDRFLRRMRQEGWYVLSVNYTTSLLRGLKGPVELTERAYRWVADNAGEYGWDPRRIGLYGISSGGHVALMTAAELVSPSGEAGVTGPPVPALVLAECAPTDLIAMREGEAFENSGSFRFFPEGRLRKLSPVRRVSAGMPPVLLFHGDADRTVHVDQSVRYAEALNAAGGEAELVVWPGGNHAFLNYSDEQWFTQETVALEWMRQRLSVP